MGALVALIKHGSVGRYKCEHPVAFVWFCFCINCQKMAEKNYRPRQDLNLESPDS